MKKIYTKLMALACMFLLAGNAWSATTVWDGSKPASTIWDNSSSHNWVIDPTQFFEIVSGKDFWIKSDASNTQGLDFQYGYYAIIVKYHHRAYMMCKQDRTVCFTMQGPDNNSHFVEFVNNSTGEVMQRKVTHAKSGTQGVGSAFTVDFKANVQYEFRASGSDVYIKKIEYLVPGQDIITLEEATDNSTNINTLKNLASSVREVRIDRTLKANQWNTFCSPVALSASTEPSLEEMLLSHWVYVIDNYDATENTLTFTRSNTLPANTPCLVKPEAKVSNIVFEAKNIVKPTNASTLEKQSNGLKFVGLYGKENIFTSDHSKLFLGSDGTTLYYPESNDKGNIKGFRAYFELPEGAAVKALSFEDDATGIITVEKDIFNENGNVYTIDGRNMGNAKNLSRGIYIQNGRKFIVK